MDFLLSGPPGLCYLEVKSVTLLAMDVCYAFPDAMIGLGHRAALVFLIQRADTVTGKFRIAAEVDQAYPRGLAEAVAKGFEVHPWGTRIDESGIVLDARVPFLSGGRPPPALNGHRI